MIDEVNKNEKKNKREKTIEYYMYFLTIVSHSFIHFVQGVLKWCVETVVCHFFTVYAVCYVGLCVSFVTLLT